MEVKSLPCRGHEKWQKCIQMQLWLGKLKKSTWPNPLFAMKIGIDLSMFQLNLYQTQFIYLIANL